MYVIGNLVWFHTDFLRDNLPYMLKVVEKKQEVQIVANRNQFLVEKNQGVARLVTNSWKTAVTK